MKSKRSCLYLSSALQKCLICLIFISLGLLAEAAPQTLSAGGKSAASKGAGVTIIMHGWNVASGEPSWTEVMQDAIVAQLGGEGKTGKITVTGTEGHLTAACSPWSFELDTATSGEIVIRVDWTAVANHLLAGVTAQETAAVLAPVIMQEQNGQHPLAELPIHLIGHSRGGGMVYELARLLGLQGIQVEQVTSLDPHPLTTEDPQGLPSPLGPGSTIDTPIKVYENILFADNYWQNISYPEGHYVSGAYNREWTSLSGGYHNHASSIYQDIADHLNIYLMYLGTIDASSPISDGEAELGATEREAWFNAYENSGQSTGFFYSFIRGNYNWSSADTPVDGGNQVRDGYNVAPMLGGDGARSALTWTNAVWPNVVSLDVLRNGAPIANGAQPIAAGEALELSYVYLDYDSASDITFYVDEDRNPYNGNFAATIASQNHTATGASFVRSAVRWDVEALAPITDYHVCAAITDGERARYVYAPQVFQEAVGHTLELSATEGGTISPEPGSHVYVEGSEITLTANPEDGWRFVEWQGGVSGTDASITVVCNSDMAITAVFELESLGFPLGWGALSGIMLITVLAATGLKRAYSRSANRY